eukprot:scaffold1504_cov417-Prasinococcus_capsulatus_cf.AAC.23
MICRLPAGAAEMGARQPAGRGCPRWGTRLLDPAASSPPLLRSGALSTQPACTGPVLHMQLGALLPRRIAGRRPDRWWGSSEKPRPQASGG